MTDGTAIVAKLRLRLAGTGDEELLLERAELTIGRALDNDLILNDAGVSLHHARIAKAPAAFYVEDLGSTNGTFVNEEPTDERQLVHGDHIRIGGQVLIFEQSATDAVTALRDETVMLPPRPRPMNVPKATLLVIEGRTDRTQYELTGATAMIGDDPHATVKLRGWFVPRVAAQLDRHPSGYAIQPGTHHKEVRINGRPIAVPSVLKDGDVIEVAGVKLSYYMQAQPSAVPSS